jgi:release factor glutamine methyltransferase
MPSIREALRAAIARLDHARVDAPVNTARVLLAQATSRDKAWLLAHDDKTLSAAHFEAFDLLLTRVEAHEPMFYVLGMREFYGLDFVVDKRVLIPRPETEMLVEFAIDVLARCVRHPSAAADLFDIGCGSGAIPVAVAATRTDARVVAGEVSADALDVARLNAQRLGVADRVRFVHSDLLANIDGLPTVLTANLPYVTREEIDGLAPEIQDHEPRVALDGGHDGLDLVRALLRQIQARLTPHGPLRAAFFEIGASQGAAALAAAREIVPSAAAQMHRDLGKRDRVMSLRWDG